MKFITTPAQYSEFQTFIAGIALEARVPPIYYDILAWDQAHLRHPDKTSFTAHDTLKSCAKQH